MWYNVYILFYISTNLVEYRNNILSHYYTISVHPFLIYFLSFILTNYKKINYNLHLRLKIQQVPIIYNIKRTEYA
jgi:hypothetical protein